MRLFLTSVVLLFYSSTLQAEKLPESLLVPPQAVIAKLPEEVRHLVEKYEGEYINTVKSIGRDLMIDASTLQPALIRSKHPVLLKVVKVQPDTKIPESKQLRKQPDNVRKHLDNVRKHPDNVRKHPDNVRKHPDNVRSPTYYHPQLISHGGYETHGYEEPEVIHHALPEVHHVPVPQVHHEPPPPVHLYGAPEPPKHKPEPPKHVETPKHPVKYNFAWGVKDVKGNDYGHWEKSDGSKITGQYNVVLPDGRRQIVTYSADKKNGFKSEVKYEGKAHHHASPPPKPVKAPQVMEHHTQHHPEHHVEQHKPIFHEYHIEQHKPINLYDGHKPTYEEYPHMQKLFIKSQPIIEQHTQHQEEPKGPVSVQPGDTHLIDYSGDFENWEEEKPDVQEYPTFQVPEGFNLFDDILHDRTNEAKEPESESESEYEGKEKDQATFYSADADSSGTDPSNGESPSTKPPQYLYATDATETHEETKEKFTSQYPKKVQSSFIHTTIEGGADQNGITTPRIRLLEVDPKSFERIARTNKGKLYDSNSVLGGGNEDLVDDKSTRKEERSSTLSSSPSRFPVTDVDLGNSTQTS